MSTPSVRQQLCGWNDCGKPSVCGLRAIPHGFVVNVCRVHFKELKGREFGSESEDLRYYKEQGVLI
jgi:hypothetical protein